MKKIYKPLFIIAALVIMNKGYAQNCYTCGTGADGVYNAVASDSLQGGTYNFTSFTIGANDTIKVKGSQPLVIHCTGKVVIKGILDASGGNGANGITFSTFGIGGIGVAGGMNGGNGIYIGAGPLNGSNGNGTGFGGYGAGWSGGGGAGFAAAGRSSGGGGGAAGISYGVISLVPTLSGSGGGGGSGGSSCGSGGGGAGGGIIIISACDSIIIGANGAIKANGGHGGSDGGGNCGGGGGGSGGSIWLAATVIDHIGKIQADSGIGGASNIAGPPYYGTGANGAVGRIRTDANSIIGAGLISPAAGYSKQPLMVVINSTNILCHGGSDGQAVAVASGGVGSYTYIWSPVGGTGATASNLTAGTYTCTVTDSTGCSATASSTITQPAQLSVTIDSLVAVPCHTSLWAVVSGGKPGYTYKWTPGGATTDTIKNRCTGNYKVVVTDSNGCKDSVTVSLAIAGIAEISNNNNFRIYPVPASGQLNLDIKNRTFGLIDMQIFDITGRKVDEQKPEPNSSHLTFDVSKLENGNYFLRLIGKDGTENLRFEISR
jgi:hypothetical protein